MISNIFSWQTTRFLNNFIKIYFPYHKIDDILSLEFRCKWEHRIGEVAGIEHKIEGGF